jgi:hypothetical protein
MTVQDRPRKDPIADHAYTLPVVREIPITGSLSRSLDPDGSEQTPVHIADSNAW